MLTSFRKHETRRRTQAVPSDAPAVTSRGDRTPLATEGSHPAGMGCFGLENHLNAQQLIGHPESASARDSLLPSCRIAMDSC
ncbi:hypothetical protein SAMN05216533_5387 [Streptomyces sp. Ag109_O5-10]|nr:hypothetical protein SAMN05216533_5387 [Streptomyces sp. Ag109_O5-10]